MKMRWECGPTCSTWKMLSSQAGSSAGFFLKHKRVARRGKAELGKSLPAATPAPASRDTALLLSDAELSTGGAASSHCLCPEAQLVLCTQGKTKPAWPKNSWVVGQARLSPQERAG